MIKPKVYFVNGTAVAKSGEHVFKNVICGYGGDIQSLKSKADVIELYPNDEGLYYLDREGCGLDFGEGYLIASLGVTAGGCHGQDGSIGGIYSPVQSYSEYVENIQAIKDLLNIRVEDSLYQKLLRYLFVAVCGEMEGYLSSTVIALIQGVRDVFLTLSGFEDFRFTLTEEKELREAIVCRINDHYQFQHIRDRNSKERRIYERLIGQKLLVSQVLIDFIEWRNKLAHRVAFFSQPLYPTKQDVILFTEHTDHLVDLIDSKILQYKQHWLTEF